MVIQSIRVFKKEIHFRKPALTSRNVFKSRVIYIVKFTSDTGSVGFGEASPLEHLSIDDLPDYLEHLREILTTCMGREELAPIPFAFPSIRFGLETAWQDLKQKEIGIIFDQNFTKGKPISINGLVWMAPLEDMFEEAIAKIESGFKCMKFKVGAHDFDAECDLIQAIRSKYPTPKIKIRLDANGAFVPQEALKKMNRLSEFDIHSIEQPIRAGNWELMGQLCSETRIPIALDEELIGINPEVDGAELLDTCRPHYIILKPNLLGGFEVCDKWIALAESRHIKWWATSALESDIGLNAISQWSATYNNNLPQGLGTGALYTNNIKSPLEVKGDSLHYSETQWGYDDFLEDAEMVLNLEN